METVERLWDKGWTFAALDQVLGVSRYTVSRWFQGTTWHTGTDDNWPFV